MSTVCYMVLCTLPDQATADEYVAWLEDGHVDAVVDGGARSAMIVRLERHEGDGLPPDARRVLTQYLFPTRELYDRYVKHHAPALRAEGLKKFGPERGVKMERLLGALVV